jgi:hypothetical protein
MQLLIAELKLGGAIRWTHFANAGLQGKLIRCPPPLARTIRQNRAG